MKKLFLFGASYLFLLCAAFACEQPDDPALAKSPAEEARNYSEDNPYAVTCEEAEAAAEALFDRTGYTTRANRRRIESLKRLVARPQTRSGEPEVSFYIVNFENDGGYALIAGDKRTTPVYAYSDKGNLHEEDFEENPGLAIFMNGAVGYYASTLDIGTLHPIIVDTTYGDIPRLARRTIDGVEYFYRSETLTGMGVRPMVAAQWHQGTPYNYFCAPNVTGCSATAAAQIMSYYKHPASYKGNNFDWDLITSAPSFSTVTTASIMVSNLVVSIGRDAKADYGVDATSINRDNLRQTIRNFGYYCTGDEYFKEERVVGSLRNGSPVWIRGQADGKRHAWVIDGFTWEQNRWTYYYTYPPYNIYDIRYGTMRYYFNCNWGGEDPKINGFCLAAAFAYPGNLRIIYNIYPIR